MNKLTTTGLLTVALMAGSAAQAEPASFSDLSFRQDGNSAQNRELTRNDQRTAVRPYHLHSMTVQADTEIAAFEQSSEKQGYERAQRMDRIPR